MQKIDRFLLVDDDDITNFLHKNLIDHMDIAHEVLTLDSAQEALDCIACTSLHSQQEIKKSEIILLDINMPVMDGFEFMEAFRARQLPDHIRIFIVSSSTNALDLQKAKELGVCGYVSKPLNEQKIMSIMKKAKRERPQACLC